MKFRSIEDDADEVVPENGESDRSDRLERLNYESINLNLLVISTLNNNDQYNIIRIRITP